MKIALETEHRQAKKLTNWIRASCRTEVTLSWRQEQNNGQADNHVPTAGSSRPITLCLLIRVTYSDNCPYICSLNQLSNG